MFGQLVKSIMTVVKIYCLIMQMVSLGSLVVFLQTILDNIYILTNLKFVIPWAAKKEFTNYVHSIIQLVT